MRCLMVLSYRFYYESFHWRDQPEFFSCEYDPSLQEQRPKHSEEQPQTQTGEEALKVHVLQVWVRGSTELHRLGIRQIKDHSNKE